MCTVCVQQLRTLTSFDPFPGLWIAALDEDELRCNATAMRLGRSFVCRPCRSVYVALLSPFLSKAWVADGDGAGM